MIKPNNQNKINKRSGRKRADYSELERQYQEAQNHWEQFNDKESYDKMWKGIQLAVFNAVNKKLEYVLPRERIEQSAIDITCNIMSAMKNKMARGKPWKLGRLSSIVHKYCLILYAPNLRFNDNVLGEDAFMVKNDDGIFTQKEYEDTFVSDGVTYLHGGYEVERTERNFEEAFEIMKDRGMSEDEIKKVIGIVEDCAEAGTDYKKQCTKRQLEIIDLLAKLLQGEE